jgi:hypothetical protein
MAEPPGSFRACYDVSSRLVHGDVPRPSPSVVATCPEALRRFVGDLLSGSYLHDAAAATSQRPPQVAALLKHEPTVASEGGWPVDSRLGGARAAILIPQGRRRLPGTLSGKLLATAQSRSGASLTIGPRLTLPHQRSSREPTAGTPKQPRQCC